MSTSCLQRAGCAILKRGRRRRWCADFAEEGRWDGDEAGRPGHAVAPWYPVTPQWDYIGVITPGACVCVCFLTDSCPCLKNDEVVGSFVFTCVLSMLKLWLTVISLSCIVLYNLAVLNNGMFVCTAEWSALHQTIYPLRCPNPLAQKKEAPSSTCGVPCECQQHLLTIVILSIDFTVHGFQMM